MSISNNEWTERMKNIILSSDEANKHQLFTDLLNETVLSDKIGVNHWHIRQTMLAIYNNVLALDESEKRSISVTIIKNNFKLTVEILNELISDFEYISADDFNGNELLKITETINELVKKIKDKRLT